MKNYLIDLFFINCPTIQDNFVYFLQKKRTNNQPRGKTDKEYPVRFKEE